MDAAPEFRKALRGRGRLAASLPGRCVYEDRDIARLMRWADDGGITNEKLDRMQADPAFPKAVRMLVRNMMRAAEADKALDGIFKDAGRYLAAMWGVYLHVSGGLTLPRLKELCGASGFLSPGRARAMLLYLRYLGYIKPAATMHGEPSRYAPTAQFMATWQNHMRAALEAARVIEPCIDLVLAQLHKPEILESFARLQSEGLWTEARQVDQGNAFVRVFMHRLAGSQVVWTLLSDARDEAFPPRDAIAFSMSGAARKFGVSRMHIKRLIEDAEREGLLEHCKDGRILIQERAVPEFRYVYAGQLIRLLIAAAKTLRERPELLDQSRQLENA